jgi:hypothetical protein
MVDKLLREKLNRSNFSIIEKQDTTQTVATLKKVQSKDRREKES